MQRAELYLTDQQVVNYVEQSWQFKIAAINYLDTGQAFAFSLVDKSQKKVFLKITQKADNSFAEFCLQLRSYEEMIKALTKIRPNCEILHIPKIIYTKEQTHFYEVDNYIFVLYEFVEGNHPVSKKDIDKTKLALFFKQLHNLCSWHRKNTSSC